MGVAHPRCCALPQQPARILRRGVCVISIKSSMHMLWTRDTRNTTSTE